MKAMALRLVEKRLRTIGAAVARDSGKHTVWTCSCGQHTVAVPRHSIIGAGVLASIEKTIACQPKGWMQ